ncbi:MAG: NTP transferase domain-containing protein [Thermoanaerobaculia bacterium]|nr:NTP transferase domain-containing protein [Thermoanaerobaculia bacterium]
MTDSTSSSSPARAGSPVALILAGGRGTRFWPLSRESRPKQLLALDGRSSLLQETVARLTPLIGPESVWICTTASLVSAVREQLPQVPAEQVLAEPEGRNTAPAIAWAVQSMDASVRRKPVIVLPADHRVADSVEFRRVLEVASREASERDRVLTLGVSPRWPETGYGYLEVGLPYLTDGDVRRVNRFTEKPDRATAERFLESGNYLWNAGIFVFRGETLLELTRRHLPELAEGLERIAASPDRLAELYPHLPRVSIDYGIMEQLDDIATLTLDCGWSDLGSWQALADLLQSDPAEDAIHGDVVTHETQGNLFWAEEGTIAAVGVRDLVVVRTGDSVLVLPRERSQEVRAIVDKLTQKERSDLL